MMEHTALGRTLAEARLAGRKLRDYPSEKPEGLEAAFAVQEAMAVAMGAPVVGWKVGLTSPRAQALCGVDQPLAGPLFEGAVFDSGVELALCEGDLAFWRPRSGFA